MSSAAASKDGTSQDVEMKDAEKTDASEEVKKDPDLLTLEGMFSLNHAVCTALRCECKVNSQFCCVDTELQKCLRMFDAVVESGS